MNNVWKVRNRLPVDRAKLGRFFQIDDFFGEVVWATFRRTIEAVKVEFGLDWWEIKY